MDFSSRRLSTFWLKIVGRHFSEYAQDLQDFLEHMWMQITGGIPGGFRNTAPNTVKVGGVASAGDEGAGWMAADAQFAAVRGMPVSIAFANSAGTSEDASAADHVHDGSPILAAAATDAHVLAHFYANVGAK